MFLQVSTSSDAFDLGQLISELMQAAGDKSWMLFAGLIMIAVVELAGRLGALNWLPENMRSPIKVMLSIFAMIGGGLKSAMGGKKKKDDGSK